jgi:hypothetical protein
MSLLFLHEKITSLKAFLMRQRTHIFSESIVLNWGKQTLRLGIKMPSWFCIVEEISRLL